MHVDAYFKYVVSLHFSVDIIIIYSSKSREIEHIYVVW